MCVVYLPFATHILTFLCCLSPRRAGFLPCLGRHSAPRFPAAGSEEVRLRRPTRISKQSPPIPRYGIAVMTPIAKASRQHLCPPLAKESPPCASTEGGGGASAVTWYKREFCARGGGGTRNRTDLSNLPQACHPQCSGEVPQTRRHHSTDPYSAIPWPRGALGRGTPDPHGPSVSPGRPPKRNDFGVGIPFSTNAAKAALSTSEAVSGVPATTEPLSPRPNPPNN